MSYASNSFKVVENRVRNLFMMLTASVLDSNSD